MRGFTATCISLALVGLLMTIGCSGDKAPTVPGDPARTGAYFNPSWTLFSTGYDEIDLAPLVWGQKTGSILGPTGDPVVIDGKRWCIAVTVEHLVNEDRIKYAWLDDIGSADDGPPVITGTFFPGEDNWEIQSAKVAAIYFYYDNPLSHIEVTVACMIRPKPAEPDNPWFIATLNAGWFEQDFPLDPFALGVLASMHGGPEPGNWSPDIAYNCRNGDMHLVWTAWTDIQPDPAKLAYERYDRDSGLWGLTRIIFDLTNPTQQWIPRVAVGDAGVTPQPWDSVVAVVYTQWRTDPWGPGPIHVGGAYWSVFDPGVTGPVFLHLMYDDDYAAGLPRIAITPDSSVEKYASIVFTQETADGYQAMEVNNIRNASTYWEYFWPIEDDGNEYGIFPAVTCHITADDPMASISYFKRVSPGNWHVTYGRFNPTVLAPNPTWQEMTGAGAVVGGELGPGDYGAYLWIHTFQGSEIVAIDGVAWDQAFWVGWCDYVDGAATTVYAAFGDTTL